MRATALQSFLLILAAGCAGTEQADLGGDEFGGLDSGASGGAWSASGAAPSTGAASGTGGWATGGLPGVGGYSTGGYATGGSATGGVSTGGVSTGGVSTGGASTGGVSTGGASTGGASTGGAATGGASSCSASDLQVCNNGTGTHCGLTYEYWKDSGTGCLTNTDDGFSVTWSNIGNLLGRKGVRPGSKTQLVTYDADYNPSGNSYLCVYGWTKGPLIEYYIVDSWGSWRPPGGTALGQVTSDDGTYDIYKTERVQQPSIEGTQTFYQYWSVRTTKRESGTITVANHFAAWAAKGMNLGSLYEVSMTVEGYQSSGNATVSVNMH